MSIFHNNVNEFYTIIINQKYYVFGGRFYGNDNVAIINDVEAFDIYKGKWSVCAAMLKSRCTGHCLIYDDSIYCFGGYTG